VSTSYYQHLPKIYYYQHILKICVNCRWFESWCWAYGICRKFRAAYLNSSAEVNQSDEGNCSLVLAWKRGCLNWEEK